MQFKTRLTMEMTPTPPAAPTKKKSNASRNFTTPTPPSAKLQQMKFKTRLTMDMIPTPPPVPKKKKGNAGRKTQPRPKAPVAKY